jgi:hypothetical protein
VFKFQASTQSGATLWEGTVDNRDRNNSLLHPAQTIETSQSTINMQLVLALLALCALAAAGNLGQPSSPESPHSTHHPLTSTDNTESYTYNRLNISQAVLLVVDLQVGLFHQVRDQTPESYRNNILAHAAIGPLFDMPTILTTSSENGPNGPLPKEILEMHPNAPLIRRQGEVNAWDNAEFRAAVEATGKKQVVLAGITTDVGWP